MIRGQGIDSGLDIGEVLQEQGSHVRIKTPAVRHRRIGSGPRPGAFAGATSRLGQLPHDQAVTDVPGNSWQLTGTIGEARGEAGDGTGHACCSAIYGLTFSVNMGGKREGLAQQPPHDAPTTVRWSGFRSSEITCSNH